MLLLNPHRYAAGGGDTGIHRYWRFINITSEISYLEFAELQLLDGTTIISEGKTYSSQVAPDGLALSNLFDGSLSTRCYWTFAHYTDPGFYIQIDLGSALLVDGVKQAGFDTLDRHMQAFTLQHSDDGSSWTTYSTKTGLAYPGNNTLSSTYTVP